MKNNLHTAECSISTLYHTIFCHHLILLCSLTLKMRLDFQQVSGFCSQGRWYCLTPSKINHPCLITATTIGLQSRSKSLWDPGGTCMLLDWYRVGLLSGHIEAFYIGNALYSPLVFLHMWTGMQTEDERKRGGTYAQGKNTVFHWGEKFTRTVAQVRILNHADVF